MEIRETLSWFGSSLRRWVRQHTTADALADGLKTATWVVPLTILIWVYSEQEQRSEEKSQPVLINVRTTESDRVITLVRRGDEIPTITMTGPKSALESVKRDLNKPGDNRLVNVDVPPGLEPGIRDITIAPQIERASIFRQNGIDVSNVQPHTIKVKIDELKQRDLEVVPSPNANIDDQVTFDPKIVRVRAPEPAFAALQQRLGETKPLIVYAQIPNAGDLAKPGIHERVPLPIQLPPELQGDNTTLLTGPNVVTTYNVKASVVDDQIPSLLIRPLLVGDMADNYVVKAPLTLSNVDIVGPRLKCDQVKSRAATNEPPYPYAILKIEPQDLPAGNATKTIPKTLDYSLGDADVIVKNANRTVDVTIRKRITGQ